MNLINFNIQKRHSIGKKTARYTRRMAAMLVVAILVSTSLMNRAEAAAGDLDLSFGEGGRVDTDFTVSAVAVQADGKIVAAGYHDISTTPLYLEFALARYNKTGAPDSSFGVGGEVTTDWGLSSCIKAVAIQADGKIVVGGYIKVDSAFNSYNFALARYSLDGTLDTAFGSNGLVTTNVGLIDSVEDLAIQSDGKIVAVGTADGFGFRVLRYNSNGSLDSTFGSGGIVSTDIGEEAETAQAVALQADGKIVVAGNTSYQGFSTYQGLLARYNANGSLDPSFGFGGLVAMNSPGSAVGFSDIAVQANGKIVAVGAICCQGSSDSRDFLITRYNQDGSPDSAFGTGGFTRIDLGSDDEFTHVAIQEDGKIIVAGSTQNVVAGSLDEVVDIVRFTSDGHLDASFGSGGKVTSSLYWVSVMGGIALYGGEQIVVAGLGFDLARYLGDGAVTSANLGVQMSASLSANTITYTITLDNYGPDSSYYVTLKDNIPANTTFLSFTAPADWVVYSKPGLGQTGTISVSKAKMVDPHLPFTSTATFTLKVRVSTAASGTTIGDRVTVSSSFTPDTYAANNSAIVYISVP